MMAAIERSPARAIFPGKGFYVLEAKAGFTDKHKIKIGDIVSIEGY